MKNRGLIIFLIVLLSVIAVILLVFMFGLLLNKYRFSWFNYSVSKKLVIDDTYEKIFENINIDGSTSDIYIKNTSDDNIRLVIYGDKEDTIVNDNDKTLEINIKTKPCFGICFNQKLAKVEIYLPEDYNNNINITNKYGDIEIGEFLNANIKVEEDAGDVSILGGSDVNITNKYGDIKLTTIKNGNIVAKAGDVSIKEVDDIIVNNALGDIKIDKVNNYLNLENNCGDIKIKNLNINKDSYIKDDLGSIKIGNTNEIYIDAKTSLGDIDIDHNYNKSDITLKITNNCGDIKVNN